MVMDQYPAIRVQNSSVTQFMDDVIREKRFSLYLNNRFITEQVASPEQLKELGAGFVICEGLAAQVKNVEVSGNEILVEATSDRQPFEKEFRSGGGCGIRNIPHAVNSSLTITPDDIFRATSEIESNTWKKTGGVHCSVLFSNGNIVSKSCDIGRHNTVDKLVGYAALNRIDLSECYIACTGRQPSGMISKSANAGIPIIISRAASTDQGILTAEQTGITLICFSRGERFTIYTHPERVHGIKQKDLMKQSPTQK